VGSRRRTGSALRRELNVAVLAEVDSIWNDPTVDAMIICSETSLHEKLVLESAHAKKHMFVLIL
jgi:predicted dehydrogenase